jgi:hypothetical protein
MATQTVEFAAAPGQTITAKLFSPGSDTVVQTASSVTGATNRAGVYSATFTDAAAGVYRLIATDAGGTPLAQWWVDLTLTTATFQSYEMPVSVMQSGLSTFDAAADTVTVGTNNDKTGYSLTVAPPTAAAVADAVWDEVTSGHTTAGTYGGQIVRSTNSNVTVQITGSNHIAADVHEFQSDVLTSAATDETFVSEVQSGLATSEALATVDSNVDTLVARITSTLFSGITSMANWLGALAGKTADASTLAEIQSTTAGATFANSTDSLEAIRDRGDAAWAPGEAGAGDASQSTLLAVQDQVEAIAGTLGGTAISVTSRIADGGSMVIYTGDDLKVRSGTQVTVSISDAAGGIYSRLSAIGTSNLSWGAARPSQAAGAISGTISSLTQSGSGDDQVVNLVIEILDAGQSLNPADDYIWQVASTSSSGDEYTEIEGTLDLRRRVAVPVTA